MQYRFNAQHNEIHDLVQSAAGEGEGVEQTKKCHRDKTSRYRALDRTKKK